MVNSVSLNTIMRWCEKNKDDPEYNSRRWESGSTPTPWELIPHWDWRFLASRSNEQILDLLEAAEYLGLPGLQFTVHSICTKRCYDEAASASLCFLFQEGTKQREKEGAKSRKLILRRLAKILLREMRKCKSIRSIIIIFVKIVFLIFSTSQSWKRK